MHIYGLKKYLQLPKLPKVNYVIVKQLIEPKKINKLLEAP